MSDVLNTKAGYAADLFPWPREVTGSPVCADYDPELWFPATEDDYDSAVALCGQCPLMDMCREVGAGRGEHGVWGGVLFKNGDPRVGFPKNGRPPKKEPSPQLVKV